MRQTLFFMRRGADLDDCIEKFELVFQSGSNFQWMDRTLLDAASLGALSHPAPWTNQTFRPISLYEQASIHNSTFSLLCMLSWELILMITEKLPQLDLLVLQRACHKFRQWLAPRGLATSIEDNLLTGRDVIQLDILVKRGKQMTLQDNYLSRCQSSTPEDTALS